MAKVLNYKKNSNTLYVLKGVLLNLRIITKRSVILVFCSHSLVKFMDLDPHWGFRLDPDPQKRLRIRNTAFNLNFPYLSPFLLFLLICPRFLVSFFIFLRGSGGIFYHKYLLIEFLLHFIYFYWIWSTNSNLFLHNLNLFISFAS
jgi:hypothetical protein